MRAPSKLCRKRFVSPGQITHDDGITENELQNPQYNFLREWWHSKYCLCWWVPPCLPSRKICKMNTAWRSRQSKNFSELVRSNSALKFWLRLYLAHGNVRNAHGLSTFWVNTYQYINIRVIVLRNSVLTLTKPKIAELHSNGAAISYPYTECAII